MPQKAAECDAIRYPRREPVQAPLRPRPARRRAASTAPGSGSALLPPISSFGLVSTRLSTGFFDQPDFRNDHSSIDGLAHIVDREGGDRDGRERLHLNAGAAG